MIKLTTDDEVSFGVYSPVRPVCPRLFPRTVSRLSSVSTSSGFRSKPPSRRSDFSNLISDLHQHQSWMQKKVSQLSSLMHRPKVPGDYFSPASNSAAHGWMLKSKSNPRPRSDRSDVCSRCDVGTLSARHSSVCVCARARASCMTWLCALWLAETIRVHVMKLHLI